MAGRAGAGGVVTKGHRLRMEIATLRAEATSRRATAKTLMAASDRLQFEVDALFPHASASDESRSPRVQKRPLRK